MPDNKVKLVLKESKEGGPLAGKKTERSFTVVGVQNTLAYPIGLVLDEEQVETAMNGGAAVTIK